MKRLIYIVLLVLLPVVSLRAEVQVDTIHGSVYQYTDTLRLQAESADADDQLTLLLLSRLQAQSDSLYSHLSGSDSLIQLALDSLREVAYQDSLRQAEKELLALKEQERDRTPNYEDTTRLATQYPRAMIPDAEEDRLERLRAERKFSPWYKEAKGLVQISQSYASGNWYQGGNSSFAMLGILKGMLRYDNKRWMTWENTLEWRAGLNTTSGDSLRKVNTSDDLLKFYSKLGVKLVSGKLYGTVTGELITNLLPTYKTNTRDLKTGPFSPVRFNVGVGVDYTQVKNLSVVVSPFAYKLVYVLDTARTTVTDHGVEEGERLLSRVGSSVRVKYKWQPLREIALETEFYAYTNYHMIELDWEVVCDFIINRYISARVMLHPRYDSSVVMDGDARAKMQFKELISVGFSHRFL